jgi:hypothetical protein
MNWKITKEKRTDLIVYASIGIVAIVSISLVYGQIRKLNKVEKDTMLALADK